MLLKTRLHLAALLGCLRVVPRPLRIFTREAARAIRAEVNDDLTSEVLDFPTIDGGLEGMEFISMAVQSAKAGGVLPKCPLQRFFPWPKEIGILL
jgi:hypothetical protein